MAPPRLYPIRFLGFSAWRNWMAVLSSFCVIVPFENRGFPRSPFCFHIWYCFVYWMGEKSCFGFPPWPWKPPHVLIFYFRALECRIPFHVGNKGGRFIKWWLELKIPVLLSIKNTGCPQSVKQDGRSSLDKSEPLKRCSFFIISFDICIVAAQIDQ